MGGEKEVLGIAISAASVGEATANGLVSQRCLRLVSEKAYSLSSNGPLVERLARGAGVGGQCFPDVPREGSDFYGKIHSCCVL